jgi:hypothetical protein
MTYIRELARYLYRESHRVHTPLFWAKIVVGVVVHSGASTLQIPSAVRPPCTRSSTPSPLSESTSRPETSAVATTSPRQETKVVMHAAISGRTSEPSTLSGKVVVQRKVPMGVAVMEELSM